MWRRTVFWSFICAAAFGLIAVGAFQATSSVTDMWLLSLVRGGMVGLALVLLGVHQNLSGYKPLSASHFLSLTFMIGVFLAPLYWFNLLGALSASYSYAQTSMPWAIGGGLTIFAIGCYVVTDIRNGRAEAALKRVVSGTK